MQGFAEGFQSGWGLMRQKKIDEQRQAALEREQQSRERELAMREKDAAYQAEVRDRERDNWRRSDMVRDEVAALPMPGSQVQVPTYEGMTGGLDEGTPTKPARVTQQDFLRQVGGIQQRAGNAEAALKANEAAQRLDRDAAVEAFRRVQSGAGSMSLGQLASSVADIFNRDDTPGGVRNIQEQPDGSVSVEVFGEGFKPFPMKFSSKEALLRQATALYDPEAYASIRKQEADLEAKLAAERAKTTTVGPGAAVIRDGKVVYQNTAGLVPTAYDAEGQPISWARAGGGGAAGGARGKPVDPLAGVRDRFEFAATKGETKLTPDQLASGSRIAEQVFTEGRGRIPESVAADIALRVATNPSLVQPSVDPRTGEVTGLFSDPSLGEVVIDRNLPASVLETIPAGSNEKLGQTAARRIIESAGRPEVAAQLRAAAHDPAARRALIESTTQEITAQAQEMVRRGRNAASVQQWRDATVRDTLDALNRKLGIVSAYTKPPRPQGGSGQGYSGRPTSGVTAAQEASSRISEEARAALASGDQEAILRIVGSPEFRLLDQQTRTELVRSSQ